MGPGKVDKLCSIGCLHLKANNRSLPTHLIVSDKLTSSVFCQLRVEITEDSRPDTVPPIGFEPMTYRLEAGCSIPLSYGGETLGWRELNPRHAGLEAAALPV